MPTAGEWAREWESERAREEKFTCRSTVLRLCDHLCVWGRSVVCWWRLSFVFAVLQGARRTNGWFAVCLWTYVFQAKGGRGCSLIVSVICDLRKQQIATKWNHAKKICKERRAETLFVVSSEGQLFIPSFVSLFIRKLIMEINQYKSVQMLRVTTFDYIGRDWHLQSHIIS